LYTVTIRQAYTWPSGRTNNRLIKIRYQLTTKQVSVVYTFPKGTLWTCVTRSEPWLSQLSTPGGAFTLAWAQWQPSVNLTIPLHLVQMPGMRYVTTRSNV